MSVQVEKSEKNMAKLTIEVSAEKVEKAIQTVYQKAKKKYQHSGFPQRKGAASADREDVWKRSFLQRCH